MRVIEHSAAGDDRPAQTVKIRFQESSGAEHVVDAVCGNTLMQEAMANGVPGLNAECGGNLSCATCHCYIDPPFSDLVPQPTDDERAMLDCVLSPEASSRLTCQVRITPEMDGMIVRWPVAQF